MIDLKFDRVSKRYLIRQETDEASRSTLLRKLKGFWTARQEFWAVRDVSFDVRRGEALGIIGQNGAGKSTILKLLSNITTPSSGEITINGRLAALIEVGSGFHPELTGRENVYLSGSILGMRRGEITRKLESIIDFAGIRQFIDTPVKRYSSGMFVRLGFSIAAHLEPDILLLDEVLAVGDAAFQSKCLNRVDALRESGKTIVFISHDLTAVERLCDRVLLLEGGQIVADGSPIDVIEAYKTSVGQGGLSAFPNVSSLRRWSDPNSAPGDETVRLRSVRVCTDDKETAAVIDIRRPVGIEITYDVLTSGHVLVPTAHFFNEARVHLFDVLELNPEWRRKPRPAGTYVSTAWIPGNFFSEGSIVLAIGIGTHWPATISHIFERDVVAFRLFDGLQGDSARGDFSGPMTGVVRPVVDWTTEFEPRKNALQEQSVELKSV